MAGRQSSPSPGCTTTSTATCTWPWCSTTIRPPTSTSSYGRYLYFAADEVELAEQGATAVTARVLVAGIGNVFLSDDGFGVEVARRLRRQEPPAGARAADFGIKGVHLADEVLEGWDKVVVVDAMSGGEAPGTSRVLEPRTDEVGEAGEAVGCTVGRRAPSTRQGCPRPPSWPWWAPRRVRRSAPSWSRAASPRSRRRRHGRACAWSRRRDAAELMSVGPADTGHGYGAEGTA